MKFQHTQEGDTLRVVLSGDLEARNCQCLQSFWELRVQGHARVQVHMQDADTRDAAAVAVLVDRIRDSVESGARVELVAAPQMLAHTLYKTGLLHRYQGLLHLDSPRAEEPYAG